MRWFIKLLGAAALIGLLLQLAKMLLIVAAFGAAAGVVTFCCLVGLDYRDKRRARRAAPKQVPSIEDQTILTHDGVLTTLPPDIAEAIRNTPKEV